MPDETRQTGISTYIYIYPQHSRKPCQHRHALIWLDIFLKLQRILEQMQIPIRLSLPWLMQMPWMHMQCTRNGRNVPVLAPCADLCACNAHVPALALPVQCIARVTHTAPWERVTLTQTNQCKCKCNANYPCLQSRGFVCGVYHCKLIVICLLISQLRIE